jgi:hypothetical protein
MSTKISLGLASYGVASYSALIFPAAAIRSVEFQLFTGSRSLFFCRFASAALFQRSAIDKPSIQIGRNHYRIGDGIGID